ncbi:VapA/VapB family virulence-associated protein [Streptomyces sp. NBC_00210]|uniref:VapA/VapB family virulence-associated protein n=1 Tax=unclassified Streptomyces TaxID=2593676 RepID=UPI00325639D6
MTEQKTHRTVSPEIVAHDFATSMHGAMDQRKIDATVEALLSSQTGYPATLTTWGAPLPWTKFEVAITGGKTFRGGIWRGNGNRIARPGDDTESAPGMVYTDDIDALYNNTVSCQYNATVAYVNINWFDGDSNLLGNFQAATPSTLVGVGGGSGSWS